MNPKRAAATCGLGLVCALAATAAGPPWRMVSLDVKAFDAKGVFVRDLRPEELRVRDAGKPQQIVFFRDGASLPHAVTVVLDYLNGNTEQKESEWSRALGALAKAESTWDAFIYVLTPSGALYPIRPMPETWAGWTPPEMSWASDILPLLKEVKGAYRELPGMKPPKVIPKSGIEVDQRPEATAWALEELRVRLSAVPGHAAIVWSGPTGWGRPAEVPHSARATAGDPIAQVPIYIAGSPSAVDAAAGKTQSTKPSSARILPYSDVREVVPRASAEARQYYRIGWIPSAENWDGKTHRLRVECTRPGIRTLAQDSYQAPKWIDVEQEQRQAVPDLLPLIAFDSDQIRFAVERDGRRLILRVDVADFVRQQGIAYLAAGVMEAAPGESCELLGGVRSVELRETGASVPVTVDLGPGAPESLRVIVQDRVSGAFGTRTLRRRP